jgi:signal transduction histidine kinase
MSEVERQRAGSRRCRALPHAIASVLGRGAAPPDWQALLDAIPAALWVHDSESLGILAANETACTLHGWSRSELLSLSVADLRGTLTDVELSSSPLVFDGRPAVLVLAQDVSQRRQLDETLARAAKMEAIGRLAGGVVHDFNNVLLVVGGYADLIARRTDDAEILEAATALRSAAERAAGLTRQLAAVSRRQTLDPEPLRMNDVVRGLLPLLAQLLGADVAVDLALGDEMPSVLADAAQLEQVVLNLAINARDAMPAGGRLRIETGVRWFSGVLADGRLDLKPGRYAVLQVTDTGTGMDGSTMARIFEPFFTTKPEGQGTGLGLATVYGIVKQSGGDVWVYSELGCGTVFKVYLPAVAAEAAAAPGDDGPRRRPRAEGTVLLVEDDSQVRSLVHAVLTGEGYAVESAGDARTALAALDHHAFDLLVTDVVMPGDSGRELADEVRARSPRTKILFISGYGSDVLARRGVEEGVRFLPKPFGVDELALRVRQVLSSG